MYPKILMIHIFAYLLKINNVLHGIELLDHIIFFIRMKIKIECSIKTIQNIGVFQKGAKVVYTFSIKKSGFISHKDTKTQRNEDFVFSVPLCENHKSVN